MNTKWGGLALAAAAAVAAGVLASRPPGAAAQADTPLRLGSVWRDGGDTTAAGTLDGVVVNGTAGAPAAGQRVTLRIGQGAGPVAERVATTDGEGRFRFDGLADGGATYLVSVTHQGVSYQTGAFRLADLRGPLEVQVHDATDQDPGLRAERVIIVLSEVDARRQEIAANELVALLNPSAQTYVPGAGGPMSLIRFSLAPGARDLSLTLGLQSDDLIQVDRGFATTAAVPPGTQEYAFAYRFPYQRNRHTFNLSLPYGAGMVRVVAPVDGPEVTGSPLKPLEERTIDGRRYRVWGASDLPPEARLTVELGHLPAPPPAWQRALEAAARPWLVAPVVAGMLLLGVGWSLRGLGSRGAAARQDERAARDRVLARLADLDDAFEEGRVTERVYRRRRAVLLDQALVAPPAQPATARTALADQGQPSTEAPDRRSAAPADPSSITAETGARL